MVCKWFESCPLRRLEKEEKISEKWKKKYCLSKNNWKNCERFKMEKQGVSHPDNLMPDGKIKEI